MKAVSGKKKKKRGVLSERKEEEEEEEEEGEGVIQPVNMVSSPPLSCNTWKTAQPDTDITARSGKTMRKTVRGDIL